MSHRKYFTEQLESIGEQPGRVFYSIETPSSDMPESTIEIKACFPNEIDTVLEKYQYKDTSNNGNIPRFIKI